MASAFIPLANITLGSAQATVTFSSISGSYRDLYLVVSATSTSVTASNIYIRINSDSGSNYYSVTAEGNGSSATSASDPAFSYADTALGFSAFTNTQIETVVANFMDYSATDKHKSLLIRANNAGVGVGMVAGRWANTAAITSFVLSVGAASFAAGSTFALYGIASA